ncbi:ABC-type glycerol-3-phosphate transport system permease component [Paenibacillus castaneae]|uniref:hypothetical protein n=1 Tax=Paenibacillus castaneae TaxID=474957 RepID=UPI000C9B1F22|nr:hypothetical protein [Paenibacillus castaneae]NIK78733.1 ABC-type glycerol-3-phosphate transport system permease component [Paenibacillus castaneae]
MHVVYSGIDSVRTALDRLDLGARIAGAVPVFNVNLIMNFFGNLPKELEGAAIVDGSGRFNTILRIFIPVDFRFLSK